MDTSLEEDSSTRSRRSRKKSLKLLDAEDASSFEQLIRAQRKLSRTKTPDKAKSPPAPGVRTRHNTRSSSALQSADENRAESDQPDASPDEKEEVSPAKLPKVGQVNSGEGQVRKRRRIRNVLSIRRKHYRAKRETPVKTKDNSSMNAAVVAVDKKPEKEDADTGKSDLTSIKRNSETPCSMEPCQEDHEVLGNGTVSSGDTPSEGQVDESKGEEKSTRRSPQNGEEGHNGFVDPEEDPVRKGPEIFTDSEDPGRAPDPKGIDSVLGESPRRGQRLRTRDRRSDTESSPMKAQESPEAALKKKLRREKRKSRELAEQEEDEKLEKIFKYIEESVFRVSASKGLSPKFRAAEASAFGDMKSDSSSSEQQEKASTGESTALATDHGSDAEVAGTDSCDSRNLSQTESAESEADAACVKSSEAANSTPHEDQNENTADASASAASADGSRSPSRPPSSPHKTRTKGSIKKALSKRVRLAHMHRPPDATPHSPEAMPVPADSAPPGKSPALQSDRWQTFWRQSAFMDELATVGSDRQGRHRKKSARMLEYEQTERLFAGGSLRRVPQGAENSQVQSPLKSEEEAAVVELRPKLMPYQVFFKAETSKILAEEPGLSAEEVKSKVWERWREHKRKRLSKGWMHRGRRASKTKRTRVLPSSIPVPKQDSDECVPPDKQQAYSEFCLSKWLSILVSSNWKGFKGLIRLAHERNFFESWSKLSAFTIQMYQPNRISKPCNRTFRARDRLLVLLRTLHPEKQPQADETTADTTFMKHWGPTLRKIFLGLDDEHFSQLVIRVWQLLPKSLKVDALGSDGCVLCEIYEFSGQPCVSLCQKHRQEREAEDGIHCIQAKEEGKKKKKVGKGKVGKGSDQEEELGEGAEGRKEEEVDVGDVEKAGPESKKKRLSEASRRPSRSGGGQIECGHCDFKARSIRAMTDHMAVHKVSGSSPRAKVKEEKGEMLPLEVTGSVQRVLSGEVVEGHRRKQTARKSMASSSAAPAHGSAPSEGPRGNAEMPQLQPADLEISVDVTCSDNALKGAITPPAVECREVMREMESFKHDIVNCSQAKESAVTSPPVPCGDVMREMESFKHDIVGASQGRKSSSIAPAPVECSEVIREMELCRQSIETRQSAGSARPFFFCDLPSERSSCHWAVFKSSSALADHVCKEHPWQDAVLSCVKCSDFGGTSALHFQHHFQQQHLRSPVRFIKQFVQSPTSLRCGLCDFTCRWRFELMQHVQECHLVDRADSSNSISSSQFFCDLEESEDTFHLFLADSHQELLAHLSTSHPDHVSPIICCPLCPFGGTSSPAVQRHCWQSHPAPPPSPVAWAVPAPQCCPLCPVRCHLRRQLIQHLRAAHPTEAETRLFLRDHCCPPSPSSSGSPSEMPRLTPYNEEEDDAAEDPKLRLQAVVLVEDIVNALLAGF